MTFRALVLDQTDDAVTATVQELGTDALPDADVTVAVEWSSLNYKDGMVLGGVGRLVRTFPHVPGVDLAGTVIASDSDRFAPGDRVVCTGFSVGERWWGGYAEQARVKSDWLVKVPDSLTTRQTMEIGTAGLTAMLCVDALERDGLRPDSGPVLCTGAAGGVGTYAVHVLAELGYAVTASTGRPETEQYLRDIGATEVIGRAEIGDIPAKPLLSERWAGCVDAVGGATLAHVIAEMRYGGSVAACGNTAGNDLPASVLPFILRSVRLLGVDSVVVPAAVREVQWQRLGDLVDAEFLGAATSVVGLEDLPAAGAQILAGQVRGRVLVDTSR
ncbi:MAG: MDR family oxidoreductase [Acidimicrobiia bacterium]|jgi:acrylyl-CoA reductase (NADPH)